MMQILGEQIWHHDSQDIRRTDDMTPVVKKLVSSKLSDHAGSGTVLYDRGKHTTIVQYNLNVYVSYGASISSCLTLFLVHC